MKIVNYVIVGLLTFTASLAVALGQTVQQFTLAAVLLLWGILLAWYQSRSYRGGAASVVGAILFGMGLWAAVGEFLWRNHGGQRDARSYAIAISFLLIAGVALLLQGHRVHKSKISRCKAHNFTFNRTSVPLARALGRLRRR